MKMVHWPKKGEHHCFKSMPVATHDPLQQSRAANGTWYAGLVDVAFCAQCKCGMHHAWKWIAWSS